MSLIPHNTVTNKVKEDGNISQNKPFLKKGKKKKVFVMLITNAKLPLMPKNNKLCVLNHLF